MGKHLYLSVASKCYFVCLRLKYYWAVSATNQHEDLHAYLRKFRTYIAKHNSERKYAEKTNAAEEEGDT